MAQGHTVRTVIWAGASPSAHVTTDAYERIAGEIVEAAREGGYDAVYLDLHGAMVAEHLDDGEGELLARVRQAVGPAVPVIASLDLHANVTARCWARPTDWPPSAPIRTWTWPTPASTPPACCWPASKPAPTGTAPSAACPS